MSCADCGKGCAKFFLILFNVVFFALGAVLFAIAIWVRFNNSIWTRINFIQLDNKDVYVEDGAYLVIAVGAFIMVTCVVGFIGAVWEIRWLLIIYIVIIFVVLAGEIAAAVLFIVYRKDIENQALDQLEKHFITYTQKNNTGSPSSMAFFEVLGKFELDYTCCGLNDQSDYTINNVTSPLIVNCTVPGVNGNAPTLLPCSCCGNEDSSKANCTATHYTDGCYQSIQDVFNQACLLCAGLLIGFGCIEIFGFIFALCLCMNLKERHNIWIFTDNIWN